jgi:hypothetical protein
VNAVPFIPPAQNANCSRIARSFGSVVGDADCSRASDSAARHRSLIVRSLRQICKAVVQRITPSRLCNLAKSARSNNELIKYPPNVKKKYQALSLVLSTWIVLPITATTLATFGDLTATTDDFQALHYMSAPAKVLALRDSPKEMESSCLRKIAERRARAEFRIDDPLTISRGRELWVADETAYFNDETADFTQIFFDIGRRTFPEIVERIALVKAEIAAGASFDAVLQKYTDDKNAVEGKGQLKGMVATRIDPVIGRLIFRKLEVGEISDAIPSRAGLHIVRLDRKSPRAKKPYEEVKRQIMEKLLEDRAKAARAKVLDGLQLEKIKLNEEVFSSMKKGSSAANDERVRAVHKEMGIPVSDPLPAPAPVAK